MTLSDLLLLAAGNVGLVSGTVWLWAPAALALAIAVLLATLGLIADAVSS